MNDTEKQAARDTLAKRVKDARRGKFRTVDAARVRAKVARGTWEKVEKGEPVKDFSLAAIEAALGWDAGTAAMILEGVDPMRGLQARDRQALANPPESSFWTKPVGDEAQEPVVWGHMEDRLGEIEERIARLERSVLRVLDAQEGGDGNERSTAPIVELRDSSDASDEMPAAAKHGTIEKSGEFNT